MPPTRAVLFFLLRFAAIYALLVAPWPGWREAYAGYFRGIAATVSGAGDTSIHALDFSRQRLCL